MVVVRIELWPHGDQQKSKTIGVMTITNNGTGTGTTEFGNYLVSLGHAAGAPEHLKKKRSCYKIGKLTGFMRSLSPYHLVIRAIKAALDNPETPTNI